MYQLKSIDNLYVFFNAYKIVDALTEGVIRSSQEIVDTYTARPTLFDG